MRKLTAWKQPIADELTVLLDISQPKARAAVNAVFYSIKAALLRGEEVRVLGFGILRWHSTPPRKRYIPVHRGTSSFPKVNTVIFKPSTVLQRFINS